MGVLLFHARNSCNNLCGEVVPESNASGNDGFRGGSGQNSNYARTAGI